MGLARLDFRAMPEVKFWKLCGSGTGEGFTPVPNTAVWAILVVWESEEAARRGVETAKVFRRWRARASEDWSVFLSATSARGTWSGKAPFEPAPESAPEAPLGPLAAITRASIKPTALPHFWRREPGISLSIGENPDVLFKIGIGEIPWLHQVTFSIWPDIDSMAAFARDRAGPHAQAIKAVRDGQWFSEELYARFAVIGSSGAWQGRDPLKAHERSAA